MASPHDPETDRPGSRRLGALRGLMPFVAPYRGQVALALLALVLTASVDRKSVV